MKQKTQTLKRVTRTSVTLFMAAAVILLTAQSALAYEGDHKTENQVKRSGYHQRDGVNNGFRARYRRLSGEQREVFKKRHAERKAQRRAEFEAFIGKSKDEISDAKAQGRSMGEVLQESGKTEQDAREFLNKRVEQKIAHVKERHDISEKKEQKIRERMSSFVEKIIGKWFR